MDLQAISLAAALSVEPGIAAGFGNTICRVDRSNAFVRHPGSLFLSRMLVKEKDDHRDIRP
jgi:hypothetical protein